MISAFSKKAVINLFIPRKPVSILRHEFTVILSLGIFIFLSIGVQASSLQTSGQVSNARKNEVKNKDNNSNAKLDAGKIQKANNLYKQGKYSEALSLYTEAGADNPQHPVLNFNIGDVFYKTGRFENAADKFASAVIIKQSDYNKGNALYKMNKAQEALAAYKDAIIRNPDDIDAKFNYEFISRQLQQKNQQGNSDKDQKNKDEQKDKDKQKQDQKDKKQGDQEKTKQEQKQIDPKQAESMLQALQQKEKDIMKKLQKEKQVKAVKNKKDW
jgi:Ca-activated chloride channel family protein